MYFNINIYQYIDNLVNCIKTIKNIWNFAGKYSENIIAICSILTFILTAITFRKNKKSDKDISEQQEKISNQQQKMADVLDKMQKSIVCVNFPVFNARLTRFQGRLIKLLKDIELDNGCIDVKNNSLLLLDQQKFFELGDRIFNNLEDDNQDPKFPIHLRKHLDDLHDQYSKLQHFRYWIKNVNFYNQKDNFKEVPDKYIESLKKFKNELENFINKI